MTSFLRDNILGGRNDNTRGTCGDKNTLVAHLMACFYLWFCFPVCNTTQQNVLQCREYSASSLSNMIATNQPPVAIEHL